MNIRTLLFVIMLFANHLVAQRTISPTDSFQVFGRVKNPTTFTLATIDTFPKTIVKDQIVYNQNGEAKDTLTNIVGVPIKTLLASIQYIYDKPKVLNTFYFVFTASDGYKVVFSWNEIYNTEIGNSFFIITEMKGKKYKDLEQRILFMATADLKTGRRYIKGLEKIEVKSVE